MFCITNLNCCFTKFLINWTTMQYIWKQNLSIYNRKKKLVETTGLKRPLWHWMLAAKVEIPSPQAGVLQIFGVYKFSIWGFFWVGKFWQVFFGVALFILLSRVFGGIHNNPKIVIVPTYAQPRIAMNKVKPNLLCACLCFLEIFTARKFGMGFLGG